MDYVDGKFEEEDFVGALEITCDMCEIQLHLVSELGKYYAVNVHEISLLDGKIQVKKTQRKQLCHYCLATLNLSDAPLDVVVKKRWDYKV